MSKHLPPELGDVVEVHRPMRGYTGWIPVLALPVPLGLLFGLGEPGPLIGVIVFVGLLVPIMYGTGEWFLLEHRFHRRGMVFRSLVPGLPTYVVPYKSCDPRSFDTIGRRVHDGTDVSEAVGRRFRQCPLTRTNILLDGLDPGEARKIAKGKAPWSTSSSGFRSNAISWTGGMRHTATWLFSSRTPGHHIALLRDLITAEKNDTRPEFNR